MYAPEQPDLARRAVVVGAFLTAVVVFVSLLFAVWGPAPVDDLEAAPTQLGSAVPRGGPAITPVKSGDAEDDPGDEDSDGGSDDDSGNDSGDGSDEGSDDGSDHDLGRGPDGSGGGSAKGSDGGSGEGSDSGSGDDSGRGPDGSDEGSDDGDSATAGGTGAAWPGAPSSPPLGSASASTSAGSGPLGTSTGPSVASSVAGETVESVGPGSGRAEGSGRKVRPLPSFGTRAGQQAGTGTGLLPRAAAAPGTASRAEVGAPAGPTAPVGAAPAVSTPVVPTVPAPAVPAHRSGNLSCTVYVVDEPGLDRALSSAGPADVICVRGGLSGPPAVPVPSRTVPVPAAGAAPGAGAPTGTRRREAARGADPAGAVAPGPGRPDQRGCTVQVTDAAGLERAINSARPGDKVCVTAGDLGVRLEIGKGGTPGSPLQVVGNGATRIKGITVTADNVVVDGFTAEQPEAPGIEITGNGITVRNNTVTRPQGGDGDGLRFFGNDINILHNRIRQTGGCGGCHADCMQTFTSGRPSSENVRIAGNACEQIDNICVMAEGPGDVGDGGGGDGTSANWTLEGNTCEFGAGQGYMIEAVQNVTMANNEFTGDADKAIGLDIGSTGATVVGNRLNGIANEVGMDSSSKKGYRGPAPRGGP